MDLKNLFSFVNIHITMYNCPHSGFQYSPPGSTVQPFFVCRDKPVRLLTLTVSACTSTCESLHSPQASEKWRSSSNATTSDNIVRNVAISARVSCGFLIKTRTGKLQGSVNMWEDYSYTCATCKNTSLFCLVPQARVISLNKGKATDTEKELLQHG